MASVEEHPPPPSFPSTATLTDATATAADAPMMVIDHGDHQHEVAGVSLAAAAAKRPDQPKDGKLPVTILTGFLGAGKTTLLNNLLKDSTHGYKFAIIENELGAIGIDDELLKGNPHDADHDSTHHNHNPQVEKVGEEVIEIINGCLCCQVRGDLMEALERLHANFLMTTQDETGRRMPAFDAVIIETTGLADPAPVVQTFFIEKSMKEKFRLDSVLTVVDSQQILTRLDEQKPDSVVNEAVQQVLFADKIFLNKIDLVSEEELTAVETRLKQLHPTASYIRCTNGVVPPVHLVGLQSFDLDRVCDLVPDFLEDDFLEFNEKHDTAVSSVACNIDGDLQIQLLSDWINHLVGELGGERLYRYKGVLAVKGMESKYVFQGVGMIFTGVFSDELTWQPDEKRVSKFVFIGKDLNAQALRTGFENCRAPETLRFPIGEEIQANCGKWCAGVVIAHWDQGNAYRLRLKADGRELWAALDVNELIRKKPKKHRAKGKPMKV